MAWEAPWEAGCVMRDEILLSLGMAIGGETFEVESAIASHPAVLESAVVGHADENGLIKPKAYVVLRSNAVESIDLNELTGHIQQHVKSHLAPYKYPRWIEFVDELPKTATGKIQRFKLRG